MSRKAAGPTVEGGAERRDDADDGIRLAGGDGYPNLGADPVSAGRSSGGDVRGQQVPEASVKLAPAAIGVEAAGSAKVSRLSSYTGSPGIILRKIDLFLCRGRRGNCLPRNLSLPMPLASFTPSLSSPNECTCDPVQENLLRLPFPLTT